VWFEYFVVEHISLMPFQFRVLAFHAAHNQHGVILGNLTGMWPTNGVGAFRDSLPAPNICKPFFKSTPE
jgi:hypothetical protein